ncbi:MAG: hypothetical protein ACKO41_06760 [Sphingomonadales bacterium]
MIDLLKEYLLFKKKLPLAGLGILYMHREPAQFDVSNRQFMPPQIDYQFRAEPAEPIAELVEWLSARMGMDTSEAVSRYQRFCEELTQLLAKGDTPTWKGWGHWTKDAQGIVQFITDSGKEQLLPVAAHKIIRDDAQHQIRVGEDSKSSVEMSQLLQQKKAPFPIEKVIAWSWMALAFLWLGWHVYHHSLTTRSFANPALIKATDSPKNHQDF